MVCIWGEIAGREKEGTDWQRSEAQPSLWGELRSVSRSNEIVAEIAAPHQNEGPHLAAGLRTRSSADRSGARGKRRCQTGRPDAEKWPTGSRTGAAPASSAPIPRTAIVRGEAHPVKTSLRRATKRRGLDWVSLPAKNKTMLGKGEWELWS